MIGEGGGLFVSLFPVLAGGTDVIVVDIAAMSIAVVRIGVETGLPGFVLFFLLCWVS